MELKVSPVHYEDLPEVCTSRDAAAYLGLSLETVQEYARAGYIRAARYGREYRFRKHWLIDFLESSADGAF